MCIILFLLLLFLRMNVWKSLVWADTVHSCCGGMSKRMKQTDGHTGRQAGRHVDREKQTDRLLSPTAHAIRSGFVGKRIKSQETQWINSIDICQRVA